MIIILDYRIRRNWNLLADISNHDDTII